MYSILLWLCKFHPSIFTCLSPHSSGGIRCIFLFQRPICDTLITFFESRRKQIEWETLSFVCKENTAAFSQIWQPSSAIWPRLGEMWAIFRPVHPIWRTAFSLVAARRTEKPVWGLENARLCALGPCSRVHSCTSVSALWMHSEGSYCVCVLASAVWHADLEGQCRNYWYRSENVVVWNANSTLCLPDRNGYLCMRLSPVCVRPLLHILDVTGIFVNWLIWSFTASVSGAKVSLWSRFTTTNRCEGCKVLHRRMFWI